MHNNSNLNLILKVTIASAFLSVLIKYGGPLLPIAATPTNVLVVVLSPTVIVAGLLGWRLWHSAP